MLRVATAVVQARSSAEYAQKRKSEWTAYCCNFWIILQWLTMFTFVVAVALRVWCINWTASNEHRFFSQ